MKPGDLVSLDNRNPQSIFGKTVTILTEDDLHPKEGFFSMKMLSLNNDEVILAVILEADVVIASGYDSKPANYHKILFSSGVFYVNPKFVFEVA